MKESKEKEITENEIAKTLVDAAPIAFSMD